MSDTDGKITWFEVPAEDAAVRVASMRSLRLALPAVRRSTGEYQMTHEAGGGVYSLDEARGSRCTSGPPTSTPRSPRSRTRAAPQASRRRSRTSAATRTAPTPRATPSACISRTRPEAGLDAAPAEYRPEPGPARTRPPLLAPSRASSWPGVRVMSAIKPEPAGPGPATHRLRWIALGAAVVVAIGVGAGVAVLPRSSSTGPAVTSAVVQTWAAGKAPAPAFTLNDQHGQAGHARLAPRPAGDRHVHRSAVPRLLPARGDHSYARLPRSSGRARRRIVSVSVDPWA